MERATKAKYDKEYSLTEKQKNPVEASRNQNTQSIHIADRLEISSDPDQNKVPISDRSTPSTCKSTIDTKADPSEEPPVNIPKIVELVAKSTNCTATDVQRRRRGILTETQLLEGNVSTSSSKDSKGDEDKSPKTLREKKERYLKKANESKSFVSRSYMKKEFEHKSITEVLLEDRKKEDTASLNKSNKSIEAISSALKCCKKLNNSRQNGSNVEDIATSSNIEASDGPSRGILKPQISPDKNSMMKGEELSPYIESHFAPLQPVKSSTQTNRENNVEKINNSSIEAVSKCNGSTSQQEGNGIVDRNIPHSDKENCGKNQDALDDVNLQDNEAKTVDSFSSGSEIDVDVKLQPSSAPTVICTSSVNDKDEKTLKHSPPTAENSKENSQTHLSQNGVSRCHKEKKSPDFPSDLQTDTSVPENRKIDDQPSVSKGEQSKMDGKQNNDSNIEENSLTSDTADKSFPSNTINLSCTQEEPNSSEKNVVKTEVKTEQDITNDGKSFKTRSVSSGLSISDIATKELANLMNDIEMYSRATLAVLNAESIHVTPNIHFRIPSPLGPPELVEPLRKMSAAIRLLDPNLPNQRATQIPIVYNPFSVENNQPDDEDASSSIAGQSSDENVNSTQTIEIFKSNQGDPDSVIFEEDDGGLVQTMATWGSSINHLDIEKNQNPQFNEMLPDDSHSEEVPDLEDEPKDLEILPDRRRGGIVYPGVPAPAPQNPAPAPAPARTPSPEQNQETAPEEESPPERQPTPAPQPTPEQQAEQPNGIQEEQVTSEATPKSEISLERKEENDQINGMIREEDSSSPDRDISEPGDLSKHLRQSATEVNALISEDVSQSPNIQNHMNKLVINVVPTGDSETQKTMHDNALEPLNPDQKMIPSIQDEIKDETMPLTQRATSTTLDQEELTSHRDEDEIKSTKHSSGVVIDTAPVPDWPNINDDEVPQPGSPPPAPHDRQNGPLPVSQEIISAERNRNHGCEKEPICEDEGLNSNNRIIRQVCPGNRRRTTSLNQPTSPKFKPIYHPGTNNEYASMVHDEESGPIQSRKDVHMPRREIAVHSGGNVDDHMDLKVESTSDEASINTVNIPQLAHPTPEVIVEPIPSSSIEANTESQLESEPKPSEKEPKTSDSKSAHTSGGAITPGVISCTLSSGSEESSRGDNSDSNQQETAESTGTSEQASKVDVSSHKSTSKEAAAGGQNPGGSGSDDEDDNTQKRSGGNLKEPPEGYPEIEKEEQPENHAETEKQQEESQRQKNLPELNQGELEPRVLLTRSKSDESAPRIEETLNLETCTLSKSHEGTISCPIEERSLDHSSESSGEEYLQPIQNVPRVTQPTNELIAAVKNEETIQEREEPHSENEPQSSSAKRKEAPSPEISETGPNKLLAREDSDVTAPEAHEPELESVGVVRPARITQRRQPVPIESDISDIDRGLSESGISEVDASSDRDASAGEVSETSDDYTARRRLTRNQAAQIEAHQQRPTGIALVSSEYDREHSSPSPEPAVNSRPSVIFTSTVASDDSSDSGSTLVPKDSASSAKSSENTLSSNSNGPAEISVAVPRQPPRLEDLDLPQDADYDMETLYYRRRPTSDPLVEVLEIVCPPFSDKRKRSSPADDAEPKKIKTEEDGDQQCAIAEADRNGEVRIDVNPEEQVSDSDREVESIMATQIKNANLKSQTRKISILIPHDNEDRTQVVIFPPRTRESSFVPYLRPKKMGETISGNNSLNCSGTEKNATTKGETRELPEDASAEHPKIESLRPIKVEPIVFCEKESTDRPQELSASNNRRESLGVSKQESSAMSRRCSLRKRESLEPPKKEPIIPKESTPNSSKKEAGSSRRDSLKPHQKGKTLNAAKTTPVLTPSLNQGKSTEASGAPRKSNSDTNKGGVTCKEPTSKKTQRDDKEDPDASSKGRNAGRRQTKSPIKKAMFRR